ncbi:hypothetical protein SLA2020_184740 [Shorea laevis]
MAFLRFLPSYSTLIGAYASLSGTVTLLQSTVNLVPQPIRNFVWSQTQKYLLPKHTSSTSGFKIREFYGLERNLLFDAAKVYLPNLPSASLMRVDVAKVRSHQNLSFALCEGEREGEREVVVEDTFRNIKVTWYLIRSQNQVKNFRENPFISSSENCYFELCFNSQNRDEVISDYLQHVLNTSASLTQKDRELKLFTYPSKYESNWTSTFLQHPASFDTIAMDPDEKQKIIDDLKLFQSSKEFYQGIGKAWKRGYLFYGPPGTGKSSLIVAIAKFLKYDVYDLDLSSIRSNSELRNVVLSISPKSVLVIEDIDCYKEVQDRSKTIEIMNNDPPLDTGKKNKGSACTLSGLLNAIDGLWSGCGEERIIILTTNHKDRIDPALIRPGRIDKQIELSYLKPMAFPVLASNYLGVRDGEHPLLEEIKGLLEHTEVTPASVAEELLWRRRCSVDHALGEVVNFLKRKKMEEVKEDTGTLAKSNRRKSKRRKSYKC